MTRAPLLLMLVACTPARADKVEAGFVRGTVTDGRGAPLAGVKVVVEHTVLHATYVHAVSNEKGRYRVAVPNGSWNVTAQIQREYHGRQHKLDLHPEPAGAFAGTAGAVRDLSLRISGPRPQGGFYGGQLTVYRDFFDPELDLARVELTLTPDGPLIDGSAGKPIVARPGDGDRIDDVPIGRYQITARLVEPAAAMKLRVRNKGEFVPSVNAVLAPPTAEASFHALEIEVKR